MASVRRPESRFRERVKAERVRLKWSQEELAKRLLEKGIELHPTAIAKIEAGDRAVRIEEAAAIADVFGVSLDALVGRSSGSGVDRDLRYGLRGLKDMANRSVWDTNNTFNAVQGQLVDVLQFEFEGRDVLEAEGKSALEHLNQAQNLLWSIASFEVPPGAEVRVREDMIEQGVTEKLLKLIAEAKEDGTES